MWGSADSRCIAKPVQHANFKSHNLASVIMPVTPVNVITGGHSAVDMLLTEQRPAFAQPHASKSIACPQPTQQRVEPHETDNSISSGQL